MEINKKIIIAAVLISILMVSLFLIFQIVISRSGITLEDSGTVLITPPALTQVSVSEAEETPTDQQEYLPGVFSTGMPVVISDTGGAGLRVRMDPGLDSSPLFLGAEGEAFNIIAGPALKDSLIWWRIESNDDPTRVGWAAQDYLEVMEK